MAGAITGQYRSPIAPITATSGSPLEVLVDSAGRLVVVATGGGGGGTSSAFGSPFPTDGTASGFNDGTNMQGARVHDLNTTGGASVEWNLGSSIRLSAPGGSVEAGTAANPFGVGVYSVLKGASPAAGVTSTPIDADHEALDVYIKGGASTGSNYGAALPAAGTPIGFVDVAGNMQAAHTYNTNSSVAVVVPVLPPAAENTLGVVLRTPGTDGSVETGTEDNPLIDYVQQMAESLKLMNRVMGRALGMAGNPATGELRAIVSTVATVSVVTTVTTVTGITNLGGFGAATLVTPQDRANWAVCVRARIT